MASSLTAGTQTKQSQGSRLMNFISGSRLKFSGTARIQLPVGTPPATCTVGEVWVATTGAKLMVCTATNTWTVAGTQV